MTKTTEELRQQIAELELIIEQLKGELTAVMQELYRG
jgi:uncharacterized coiled-coil protein SlyX